MSDEEQAARKATFKDGQDGSLTFALEGGGQVVVESVQQLMAQEMALARESAEAEAEKTIARRLQANKEQQAKAAAEAETEGKEEEAEEDWYDWGRREPNQAFWAAYVAEHGMPTEGYAQAVHEFTERTGVRFEMDDDDDDESGGRDETAAAGEG